MVADVLEPEGEQGHDDLLDRPGRPGTAEDEAATIVEDVLRALLVPDDVRLRQRDLGRDPDVGETIVQEVQVVEDVRSRLAAVDVDPQSGRSGRHLLGQSKLAHAVLS